MCWRPACLGAKETAEEMPALSVGEGWSPHSITEVSGFKPQSALKRPQTETQKELSAKYFTSFLHCHHMRPIWIVGKEIKVI